MNKRFWAFLTSISTLLTLVGCAAPLITPEQSAKMLGEKLPFTEMLLKYSCWSGYWQGGNFSGRNDLCFKREGGVIVAYMERSTGSPFQIDGKVHNLVIDEAERTVKYRNNMNFPYTLKLTEKGTLEGTALGTVSHVLVQLGPRMESARK